MLWSDPPQEPSEELRRAQQMLRRAGLLIALLLPLATLIAVLRD